MEQDKAFPYRSGRLLASSREYDAAVARIDALLAHGVKARSAADAELDYLALVVEDFDRRHFRWPDPGATPQDVVSFLLDQRGIDRGALAPIMGGRSRVSEFFAGKRPLSLGQVVALRDFLHAPADLLIGDQRKRRLGQFTYAGQQAHSVVAGRRDPAVREGAPRKRLKAGERARPKRTGKRAKRTSA